MKKTFFKKLLIIVALSLAFSTFNIFAQEGGEESSNSDFQSEMAQFSESLQGDNGTSPSATSEDGMLAPRLDEGSESSESMEPFTLFKTNDDVKNLLMNEPRFIYNPKRLPDPMIIPWVRDQLLAKEKLDRAKQLMIEKDYNEVLKICNDITENHKNAPGIVNQASDLRDKAKKALAELGADKEKKLKQEQGKLIEVELPQAVRNGTKGILFSSDGVPLVLVDDNILSEGDEVPNNKGVFIEKVKKTGEVLFRYKGVLFPVTVKTLP